MHSCVTSRIALQGASTPVLVRTSRPTQDPQGGRTKFIRLLARAVGPDRNPLPVILPDVSEPFAVRGSGAYTVKPNP